MFLGPETHEKIELEMKLKREENTIQDINNVIQDVKANGIINSAGKISDGYHTFDELYHHRALLFACLCNVLHENTVWKSKLHSDGTMFDGMFIAGMETPEGQATYHYNIDPYWDMFKVKEVDRAPEFDGHTPTDALNRIYNYFTAEES